MAFMMPVVKNDWDIYKSNRTRKTSECNTASTVGRTRKISECRSEGQGGFSTPPNVGLPMPKHHSMPDRMATRGFSRPRTSSENLPNRAKVSVPPEKNYAASMKQQPSGTSWLDKLKKFMKNGKSEEERTKS